MASRAREAARSFSPWIQGRELPYLSWRELEEKFVGGVEFFGGTMLEPSDDDEEWKVEKRSEVVVARFEMTGLNAVGDQEHGEDSDEY